MDTIYESLVLWNLKNIYTYQAPKLIVAFDFQTGDEMSKRAKFVLITWVGPDVSVMKKAKMSTDKALMKDIVQVRKKKMF